MPSVAFVSLGCAKNLVDTEVMIAKLGAAGWRAGGRRRPTPIPSSSTRARSSIRRRRNRRDVILEHAARKRPGQQLIVAGCLAQRYGEQLQSLIPEIDGVVGTGAYAGIVELLDDVEAGKRPGAAGFRARTRARLSAASRHDAARHRLSQDRRRLRSSVHVLHHPGAARQLPQPQRGVDSATKRARLRRRRHERADPDRARHVDVGPRPRRPARRPRRAAGAAARDRRLRVDPPALPLSGHGRSRADRRDRALAESLQVHGHAAAARASRRAARDAAPGNGERYLEIIDEFRASAFPASRCARRSSSGSRAKREEHVEYLEEWIGRAELDRVGFFEYSAEEGTPGAELPRARSGAANAANA